MIPPPLQVWMLIGALSSFLVGFSLGALIAGIFIYGNVAVTLDLQVFFFIVTLEPRVVMQQPLSLKYEPSSEPLHISAKQLF